MYPGSDRQSQGQNSELVTVQTGLISMSHTAFSHVCGSFCSVLMEDKWSYMYWLRACFQGHKMLDYQETRGVRSSLSWCFQGDSQVDPPISGSTSSSQLEDRGGIPNPGLCDPRGEHRISLVGCARFVSSMVFHAPDEEEWQFESLQFRPTSATLAW